MSEKDQFKKSGDGRDSAHMRLVEELINNCDDPDVLSGLLVQIRIRLRQISRNGRTMEVIPLTDDQWDLLQKLAASKKESGQKYAGVFNFAKQKQGVISEEEIHAFGISSVNIQNTLWASKVPITLIKVTTKDQRPKYAFSLKR